MVVVVEVMTVISSAGQQARRWLLLSGPRYDHLLAAMFLPYNNQVCYGQIDRQTDRQTGRQTDRKAGR
ncbi:hypothetical protein E2C01_087937 [Portunus trituberculatus]|uniref:Uncharacterized protein n=1 Tax=Portunus trituberculatus TaxID=210409 RepID=A0A5B7JHU6_PORTR|nr:hypothetical protein [Portunus trituberculatus]